MCLPFPTVYTQNKADKPDLKCEETIMLKSRILPQLRKKGKCMESLGKTANLSNLLYALTFHFICDPFLTGIYIEDTERKANF